MNVGLVDAVESVARVLERIAGLDAFVELYEDQFLDEFVQRDLLELAPALELGELKEVGGMHRLSFVGLFLELEHRKTSILNLVNELPKVLWHRFIGCSFPVWIQYVENRNLLVSITDEPAVKPERVGTLIGRKDPFPHEPFLVHFVG